MEVGDQLPDLTLLNENEESVSLRGLKDQPTVLFFYPKADTPGWTIEACGFRDAFKKLQKTGVRVLGISADKPSAQKKFQQKYDLPYSLLADTEKEAANAFGVIKEKNMYGKKVKGIARTTFVLNGGKVVKKFENVKPDGHAEEVLAALKK